MTSSISKKASTIILYRQTSQVEVYMLQRSATASFMPNALVFPGGALDDHDREERWQKNSNMEHRVAKKTLCMHDAQLAHSLMVAAVRETFEEAGILITQTQPKSIHDQDLLRKQLNSGNITFQSVVERLGLTLDLNALTFISRWITPKVERRRFDAYFFMAQVPHGNLQESADGTETLNGRWMTPAAILRAHSARRNQLAPPTLRAIETLCATPFSEWKSLQRTNPEPICPQVYEDATLPTLVLPDDPAYKPAGVVINRFQLHDGYWSSKGVGF